LHECLPVCDFSVTIPVFENLKPALVRNMSTVYVAETVSAIVRDVDRFYKPRVSYRRRFTLDGVSKYATISKLRKHITFLHGSPVSSNSVTANSNAKRKCYNRSVSMFETSNKDVFLTNDLSSSNRCDVKYVVQDFIMAERFSCYMETGKTHFFKNTRNPEFDLNLRGKKNRASFKKIYRKSFPFTSSTNNERFELREIKRRQEAAEAQERARREQEEAERLAALAAAQPKQPEAVPTDRPDSGTPAAEERPVHGQQPQQPTPVSAPVAQRVQSTPPQPSPRSQTRKYDS
jgi:hypothetical protein